MQPACSNLVYTVECSWSYDVSRLTVRHLSRPRWGRDDVCVAAVGGKTPDISSERRTFADVMTENKLKAKQVRWSCAKCLIHRHYHEHSPDFRNVSMYSGLGLAGSQWTDQYSLQAGGLLFDCLTPHCPWSASWKLPVLRWPVCEWVHVLVCWGPTLTRWPSAWSKQR